MQPVPIDPVNLLLADTGMSALIPWMGWGLALGMVGVLLWRRARTQQPIPGPAPAASSPAPVTRETPELRSLLDAIESPLLGFGPGGEVWFANEAAGRYFEDRFTTLIGTHAEQLFTQADVLAAIADARGGRAGRTQIRVMRPQGQRIYQAIVFPLASSGAVLSLRDITELAHAVQLKADFVANASHELRTPLSSIRAAAETLAHDAQDDPPMQARLASIIAGNVTRLEDLIADLLDLSRLESTEDQPTLAQVDARAVIDELAELFAPLAAGRGLAIRHEIDAAVSTIQTDRRLFMLILKNLIENATKYAYEKTTIRVTGRLIEREGVRAARFEVHDKGAGIPIDLQHRIFERFFQVDPARTGTSTQRGTGLGLAIVKHAVKTLGGDLGVKSVWKEGTTIWVELPRPPAMMQAQGESGA